MAVYPPQRMGQKVTDRIVEVTTELALGLNTKGILNIQFVIAKDPSSGEDTVYVIEANPRASRTVPFLSKVTGVSMAEVATRIIRTSICNLDCCRSPRASTSSLRCSASPSSTWSTRTWDRR